jgi:hypothetical protein
MSVSFCPRARRPADVQWERGDGIRPPVVTLFIEPVHPATSEWVRFSSSVRQDQRSRNQTAGSERLWCHTVRKQNGRITAGRALRVKYAHIRASLLERNSHVFLP